jgi:hypothetical protein
MNMLRDAEFIEKLDGLEFHRESLTDEDHLLIGNFVKKHQLGIYREASRNSEWVINKDRGSLMFRLSGGLRMDDGNGGRTPLTYGLIFEGQPLVFKANITPQYSTTQAHWSVLELIIHPNSFFSKIHKDTIFKIINYFVKNGYKSEYLSKFIPEDVDVNFSKFKRVRAIPLPTMCNQLI